jgi:hypothetical protein
MRRSIQVCLIGLVVIGLSIPAVQYWRSESLGQLQRCRAAIPSAGREYFESPCVSMRFSALILSGISRGMLDATLGNADFCFDPPTVSAQRYPCLRPGWAFFYLPPNSLGGGAHLVCLTGGGKICRVVYWEYTA